jgi:dolichyl-phosphate-mannose--protein O-mannosyl transferase
MLEEISYYLILGIPFIVYLGIITIAFLLITAIIALLKRRGKIKISIKWHFRMAYLSIFFASIHGFLGIIAYF